ncbi:MAG: GNAT family N-acetyltransferase [Rhodocyclaceae bacterium]|nr:GNAT family N-acetyltransferase [Rhodocyclaceae bacterium]
MKLPLRGPELFTGAHDVSSFDCGSDALNRFLQRHALNNQRNQSARTYVALRGETRAVGFYTLAAASAEFDFVPARLAKGLARHPIPLTLLARLAVDSTEQGAGLGTGLLKDALKRYLQAQSIIAARALVVQARDERASAFYRHFGFAPSPIDASHLFLMTKDIHASML